jgi:hypothetical protein
VVERGESIWISRIVCCYPLCQNLFRCLHKKLRDHCNEGLDRIRNWKGSSHSAWLRVMLMHDFPLTIDFAVANG